MFPVPKVNSIPKGKAPQKKLDGVHEFGGPDHVGDQTHALWEPWLISAGLVIHGHRQKHTVFEEGVKEGHGG